MLDVVAVLVVWLALIVPNDLASVGWPMLVAMPIEFVVLGVLALLLPARAVRPVAVATGALVAVLTVVKVFDMGFTAAFGRLFRPPWDVSYLGSGIDLLSVSIGRTKAWAFVLAAASLIVALLVLLPWALDRAMRVAREHRRAARPVLAFLAAAWLVVPTAATASSLSEHAELLARGMRDTSAFDEQAALDPLAHVADTDLLSGLRGKDVLVAFVESYGRVAVEDPSIAPAITGILDDGTARLARAGYTSRSAFLTSSTFGGLSWLAHSTLQSGLWVDSQQRYDRLLSGDRTTLASAFHRAGWRTVSDVPSNEQDWSAGQRFYDYDVVYDAGNVGYRGPRYSYASMPDQYVLDAFRRLELARSPRKPVMAELDLVSSHTPWTPLPTMVPWPLVGDGSVFLGRPSIGVARDVLWRDPQAVKQAYGASIEYTLRTLISFVETFGDPNLVLVIVGDHQPATIVSGSRASHDVPISIVAKDPAVVHAIEGWGWQPGLHPRPDAPVTRMDALRDQFVRAFTPSLRSGS